MFQFPFFKINFSKTIDKYLATADEKYAVQAISVAEGDDIESLQHRLNGNATLLELAALLSHYNVIKELVKRGADINAITYGTDGDPKNALYLCCAKNNLNMVKYLIDNGANVNVVFGGKMTPLMLSANLQFEELTILLINNGADVNAKDVEGWTALMAASKKGNLNIVKALIGANANINSRSNSGSTALSIARQYDNSDIINFLNTKGAR